MTRRSYSIRNERSFGFTIIELLLVITIIGAILAVIVPRAWRAGIEAKYGLLQQDCSELASWANEWAQRQMEAQALTDTSNLNAYIETLAGEDTAATVYWVGESSANNWNNNNAGYIAVDGRAASPTVKVEGLLPAEKKPRNPFSGLSVFASVHDVGTAPVSGAIGCAWVVDGTYRYYALIFLGNDSTAPTDFYGGQGTTLAGLRNGTLLARLMP
jgi:type II secretory pathway pseudopilin PulG